MLARLIAIIFLVIVCMTGCTNDREDQPIPVDHSATVLNKEQKSGQYVFEISSGDRHEYVEVSKRHWDQVEIHDTVSFDRDNELVMINNSPVE